MTFPFGQGGKWVSVVGVCQGANCKCLSLMSSVINKASEHSSPRRLHSRVFLKEAHTPQTVLVCSCLY